MPNFSHSMADNAVQASDRTESCYCTASIFFLPPPFFSFITSSLPLRSFSSTSFFPSLFPPSLLPIFSPPLSSLPCAPLVFLVPICSCEAWTLWMREKQSSSVPIGVLTCCGALGDSGLGPAFLGAARLGEPGLGPGFPGPGSAGRGRVGSGLPGRGDVRGREELSLPGQGGVEGNCTHGGRSGGGLDSVAQVENIAVHRFYSPGANRRDQKSTPLACTSTLPMKSNAPFACTFACTPLPW